jgi:hypothetical protein
MTKRYAPIPIRVWLVIPAISSSLFVEKCFKTNRVLEQAQIIPFIPHDEKVKGFWRQKAKPGD